METMGRLLVTTYCTNCDDFTKAVPENGTTLDRCTECGCYASSEDVCCAQHELRKSPYPSGECPRCEQERHRQAIIQERQERRADPNMHPSVDAARR